MLVLLGFVATDFVITITLSAADATAHVLENPFAPGFVHGQQVVVTLVLIALLGAVFLRGFTEAIGIAVVLVIVYLTLNAVVVAVSLAEVVQHPNVVGVYDRGSHDDTWYIAMERLRGPTLKQIVHEEAPLDQRR